MAKEPTETGSPEGRDHRAAPTGYVKVVLFTPVVAGIAWLLTRHAGHMLQMLPYLLLLACPLMHFLHHGRHGRRVQGKLR